MSSIPLTRVKIDHEHYIPIPKHRIRECLLRRITDPTDREKFRLFCRIIESIYHFEYHETQEELKRDFMLFNPANGSDELKDLEIETIEEAEATFLSNFFTTMEKGNFTALNQEDYDVADEEDFLFNLPVKIDLDKLDNELLPRYFDTHPDLCQRYFEGELPEFARRVMIFRRGVGVEQFRGFLFLQKFDVLIDRFLTWLFALPGNIIGLFIRKKTKAAEEDPGEQAVETGVDPPSLDPVESSLVAEADPPDADLAFGDEPLTAEEPPQSEPNEWAFLDETDSRAEEQDQLLSDGPGEIGQAASMDRPGADEIDDWISMPEDDPPVPAAIDEEPNETFALAEEKPADVEEEGAAEEEEHQFPDQERSVIFDDRYIDRITPKHVTRSIFSVLRRHTIQEPTFLQLVILFRYATPEPVKRLFCKKPEPPPKDRSIYIKQFRDIPMADLEVVYPEKRLSMKPIELIKFAITGLVGVVVVVVKAVGRGLVMGPVAVVISLATLGGYCAKIAVGWKNSRNRYEQLVTHSLYHKNLDNDLGVIFYLMDSLEEQEFKEAVLGYYFLWLNGPKTMDDLDAECEQYIKDEFGIEVDFEVDDALDKLLAVNLVTERDGVYYPVSLPEACRILDAKWNAYFQEN